MILSYCSTSIVSIIVEWNDLYVQRKVGLKSQSEGGHVDVCAAWIELAQLAQCRGRIQEGKQTSFIVNYYLFIWQPEAEGEQGLCVYSCLF